MTDFNDNRHECSMMGPLSDDHVEHGAIGRHIEFFYLLTNFDEIRYISSIEVGYEYRIKKHVQYGRHLEFFHLLTDFNKIWYT